MENNKNFFSQENLPCPAVGYQAVNVKLPVTISGYAQAGVPVTKCCGPAIVLSGGSLGHGVKNGCCNFTIGQNIIVSIPVDFGAQATTGDTYVECLGASATEIDCASLIDAIIPTPTPKPPVVIDSN